MCEIHQSVASHTHPTGNLAHNPGMCPDWESNWRPFGLQGIAQCTDPYQSGLNCYFPRKTLTWLGINFQNHQEWRNEAQSFGQYLGCLYCLNMGGKLLSCSCTHTNFKIREGTLYPGTAAYVRALSVCARFYFKVIQAVVLISPPSSPITSWK